MQNPLVRYSNIYRIDSLYNDCLLFRRLLYRLVLEIERSTLVPVEYRILILPEKTDPHRRVILIQKQKLVCQSKKVANIY